MKDLTNITLKIKNLAREAKREREHSQKVARLEELQNELRKLEQELKFPKEATQKGSIQGLIGRSEKRKYIKEANISEKELKNFITKLKKKKSKKTVTKSFSVYKTNPYFSIANLFFEGLSFKLEKRYPDEVTKLTKQLASANINVLSKTYISMALFSGIIAFPIIFAGILFLMKNLIWAIASGIIAMPAVAFLAYKYPVIRMGERAGKIRQELVFAVVHMAAIAGSGARPVEIFKQLTASKEYEELEVEFRRIDNYMNLFGYSLSNALRAVTTITPSPEFAELLNGIVSTIETGGDLTQNLEAKSEDSLVKFRLDQKKNLQKIETYSDLYTGLLIAGPLLMIVTLAILERISPTLGGISIATLSLFGVFVLLPLLNVIYMLILETSKTGI